MEGSVLLKSGCFFRSEQTRCSHRLRWNRWTDQLPSLKNDKQKHSISTVKHNQLLVLSEGHGRVQPGLLRLPRQPSVILNSLVLLVPSPIYPGAPRPWARTRAAAVSTLNAVPLCAGRLEKREWSNHTCPSVIMFQIYLEEHLLLNECEQGQ